MSISKLVERLTILGVKQNLDGSRAVVYKVTEDGKEIGKGVLVELDDVKVYVEFEEIERMGICFVRELNVEKSCKCDCKEAL